LGTPWGDQQEGEWEMKGYGGVKMIEVWFKYTCEDGIRNPPNTVWKVGEEFGEGMVI
jgi:hypothetical protein